MLKINFDNISSKRVGNDDGISEEENAKLVEMTPAAHAKIRNWRKSGDAIFYDIIDDPKNLEGILEIAETIAGNFENLVILGIGGSALGLRCLSQALLKPFWNIQDKAERGGKPCLFICDNIDPDTFSSLMKMIDLGKTCFTIISKSGRTTETAAQFFLVLSKLRESLGDDWKKNVVIITDPKSGELRPMVEANGLKSFEIHPKLGGRFSVLSPVGLFPAACLGVDIETLLAGARDMAKRCAGANFNDNPAYKTGGYHYLFDTEKGKNISVMMPYADGLLLASDWYAQLWAESLGKDGHGQTPVKALGATDQHSQVQLYMEGPGDKVFTFLGVDEFASDENETKISDAPDAFDYINGINLGTILKAEQNATSDALTRMKRPNMTITFPKVDAHHLGEFFMLYEIATAYAGALYGFDPFDQPGVELGKKLTREKLTKN